MNAFRQDIWEQAAALRRITNAYAREQLQLPGPSRGGEPAPLLTGMGASLNAASIASFHLNQMGLGAIASEATDLLFYGDGLRTRHHRVVFVSQSGASAEVVPFAESLRADSVLFAVTNHPDSPLAQRADGVLPVLAGAEAAPVASKTYVNTLAALWLLARHWGGGWNGREADALDHIADRIDALLAQSDQITERWLDRLSKARTLLFVGHGPHAATARQSAMMINEWVKRPSLGMSIGAFRHGPIEITRSDLGVVIFAAPGKTQASAWRLADELEAAGAQVVLVEAGKTRLVSDTREDREMVDEFLTPILDVIPAQLFTDALAQYIGVDTTFRHITKVVTRL